MASTPLFLRQTTTVDPVSMTVYLVRHASAGKRGTGCDDLARRLDESGRAQAQRLVQTCADADIASVWSSQAVRCVETVEPLASAHDLPVERHPDLFEGTSAHAALDLILASVDTNAVFCSHGDVIPGVLQLLVNRGLEVGTARGFAKGSVWIIESDGERFVTGTYSTTHV